jgi:glycogen(starch) synthase
MSETKILMLAGDLSGSISGGMGIAASHIALHLSDVFPLQLIVSGSGQLPLGKNVHLISGTAAPKEVVASSPGAASLVSTTSVVEGGFDFLISPYRNDVYFSKKTLVTEQPQVSADGIETVWYEYPSYLEEVALFNQRIVELAQTLAFDVIYCHDWTTFQAGISLKLLTGKKLVLHIHSLETDRHPVDKNEKIYYLERKAMDYANAVIAVSNYTKNLIRKNYEIYPDKIHVVYNGHQTPPVAANAEKRDEKNVLFMGRLTKQKGIETFVNLAEHIAGILPNVRFLIAGDGVLRHDIEERLDNSEYADNILLLGHLEETAKNELLAITDVLCLPSESEPFGLSALEAAARGIPCVISKQSGISECMPGALQADFYDEALFVQHLLLLLQDDAVAKSIAAKQLEEIKDLSWQNTAATIQKILAPLAL